MVNIPQSGPAESDVDVVLLFSETRIEGVEITSRVERQLRLTVELNIPDSGSVELRGKDRLGPFETAVFERAPQASTPVLPQFYGGRTSVSSAQEEGHRLLRPSVGRPAGFYVRVDYQSGGRTAIVLGSTQYFV